MRLTQLARATADAEDVSNLERVLFGAALPTRLRDLGNAPATLFVRGELPRGPAVAIIGTREPSVKGRAYARRLAAELAAQGVAILSGGAVGIDTAAHCGALKARGVTVVVAPSGFERPSPAKNAALFRKVVRRGGAFVSLVEANVPASYATYFPRNAVLAALAHVVVVIEAGCKSGARNTAATARRLGRPLLVCAAPPWLPKGAGCLEELRLGARPLSGARDVLRELAAQRAHAVAIDPGPLGAVRPQLELFGVCSKSSRQSTASEHEASALQLCQLIRGGATYVDELCAASGLSPQRVQELLLTLTLDGVLVSDSSGRITIVNT